MSLTRVPLGAESAPIHHRLHDVLDELRGITSRRELENRAVYHAHKNDIADLVEAVEWSNTKSHQPRGSGLRAVAWNLERGINARGIIDFIKNHPELQHADVLLLTEADVGMGRSGNLHVAKFVADNLGMNYCFSNCFLNLTHGDEGERTHGTANALGLHGIAVLSRLPFKSFRTVTLPPALDYFHTFEKRFGNRRALICQIEHGSKLIDIAVVHLEVHSSARQRARQLQSALQALHECPGTGKFIAGDFNTSTYDLGSTPDLAINLFIKLCILGFKRTIWHYMKPFDFFERHCLRRLRDFQFSLEEFNDQSQATFLFDINESATFEKANKYVPAFSLRWLKNKLTPMGGRAGLRLDWAAARNLRGKNARVIELPQGDARLSDHLPIMVDLFS